MRAGACLALLPAAAAAQESVSHRLGIDRLRFSGIGGQAGVVKPQQILSAPSYTLVVDYGEIAPAWRIVFNVTYWGSRFEDRAVRAYADSLRAVIVDPTGDADIQLGDITVSDIAFSADVRREIGGTAWIRPFVGGSLAAHVVNADGRLIDGTFVERAIDNIAAGLGAMAGIELRFLGHLAVNAQARYDLLSLARFASVRVGGTYYFDPPARGGVR